MTGGPGSEPSGGENLNERSPSERSNGKPSAWLGLAAIAILFTVVAVYFAAHKPLKPDNAVAILLGLRDFVLAGALVALGGGIGRRFLPSPHTSTAASLSVQAALGLGWMGLGAWMVGWLGGAQTPVAWAGLVGLGLIFGRQSLRWLAAWRGRVEALGKAGRLTQVAVALAALLLGMALLEASAPPVHFDALVYHLELPRRFLAQRSFALIPDNPFWGLPLLGESLYTWALALGRLQTASILGWMAAALTLAGVVGVGASWAKPAGWASLLALIGGASLSASPGWGYVDWWAALFGMGMLVLLDSHSKSPSRSLAAVGGLLAGFACGVKYTAWLAFPAGFLAFWVANRSRQGFGQAVIFAAVAALAAVPWVWKNWSATGAPLYPYLGSTAWLQPERQAALLASVEPPDPWISLGVPIAATLTGHEQAPGFASDIGPLLLGLLPGLALVPRASRPRLMPTGAFLIAGWAVWATASIGSGLLIQTRLYFVLLPAWALLAGAGLAGFEQASLGRVRLGRLATALVVLVIALLIIQQVREATQTRAAAVVLGEESESTYLTRRLGGTYVAQQTLRSLPEDSSVLMLWEPRALYCSPGCIADPWIDRWLIDRHLRVTPAAILQSWRDERVTHVLLFEKGREFVQDQDQRYTDADWQALDELLRSLRRVDRVGDSYTLFELP